MKPTEGREKYSAEFLVDPDKDDEQLIHKAIFRETKLNRQSFPPFSAPTF
jgi:hypothetical protein